MINRAVIMGRLTHNPELRTTPSNIFTTKFAVAVERSYVKAGEERQADFIDVVAWRQTAEFVNKYFCKGSMIAVDGHIQTNNFTDKEGNKRKSVQIVADSVSFCGEKKESTNAAYNQSTQYQQAPNINIPMDDFDEISSEDELPF